MGRSTSNREKVEKICQYTGTKRDDFDLIAGHDFDQLLRSMDDDKIVAGLYLSRMRSQYHNRMNEPQEEAVNEWWFNQFDNMLTLIYTGSKPPPKRLH